jgi:hypothetical protein
VRNRVELTDVEDGAGAIGGHTRSEESWVIQVWSGSRVRYFGTPVACGDSRLTHSLTPIGECSRAVLVMHDGVGIGVVGCHFVYSGCRTTRLMLFHRLTPCQQ